jgi:hypothetical protein
LPDEPAAAKVYAPVEAVANPDLPPVIVIQKTVANPEVSRGFATGGKTTDSDDLLDEFFGGKNVKISKVSKGWRLERNSDGRLRWRWQVKDNAGNSITYAKPDGQLGYKRGSEYVGITQRAEAEEDDRTRVKGKHKRRRSSKARR